MYPSITKSVRMTYRRVRLWGSGTKSSIKLQGRPTRVRFTNVLTACCHYTLAIQWFCIVGFCLLSFTGLCFAVLSD